MKIGNIVLSLLMFLMMLFLQNNTTTAQVSINSDGSSPNPTAILDVNDTSKGMLIPRMTEAQVSSILNPADGLQVFCTDNGKMYIYVSEDDIWKEIQYGSGEIDPPALYSIGSENSCTNTNISGSYNTGVVLGASNTVTLDASVNSLGTWKVNTDTVNGYSFNGNGVFITTGTVQITLQGNGTPVAAQSSTFTATAEIDAGSCEFSVNVSSPFNCGSLISYEGQGYNTVLIGTQCWMAENLNVGTRIDAVSDQSDNGVIEKYCFNDLEDSCDVYGGLYQWNEIMEYVTTEGVQGICPNGWHIPTNAEWKILEGTVDTKYGVGDPEWDGILWRGWDAGERLKSTTGWNSNGNGTNVFGFTAFPSGVRDLSGAFLNIGDQAYWWSSTELTSSGSCGRSVNYNHYEIYIGNYYKTLGMAVRCIMD